jgi:hypothetical protein
MNDPGLDVPIDRDAQILESKKEDDELDEAEEDEQAFLAPRYVAHPPAKSRHDGLLPSATMKTTCIHHTIHGTIIGHEGRLTCHSL